jgi:hypothetical protein
MTYPLIGNYGVTRKTRNLRAGRAGFIVREARPASLVVAQSEDLPRTWSPRRDGHLRRGHPGPDPPHPDRGRHARCHRPRLPRRGRGHGPHPRSHPRMEGLDLACGVSTTERLRGPAVGEERIPRGRLRLRREGPLAEAPGRARVPGHGASCDDASRGPPGPGRTASSFPTAPGIRRRWPGRGGDPGALGAGNPRLRDLPGAPAHRPGLRGIDLQAPVRAPRRQPPGQGPGPGHRGDHVAEPRLCRPRATTTGPFPGPPICG